MNMPPLAAIRAFELAAEHQSLRIAAERLRVTPSAVSHQIRGLEEWLGAPVFERVGRDVRLTELGKQLAGPTSRAFQILTRAFGAARQASADRILRVSTLSLFAQAWLLPRLSRFEAAHPGLSIAIDTTDKVLDFDADPVDVAIRLPPKPSGKLTARKLIDLYVVPACTPALARKLHSVNDLATVPMITVTSGRRGWREWLTCHGVPNLKPRSVLSFDTMVGAVEAAGAGHGVMLGLAPLIWELPAAKGLVVPLGAKPAPAGSFFLVHRKTDAPRSDVRRFVDWVTAEIKRDTRRPAPTTAQRAPTPAMRLPQGVDFGVGALAE